MFTHKLESACSL